VSEAISPWLIDSIDFEPVARQNVMAGTSGGGAELLNSWWPENREGDRKGPGFQYPL
jgi:hypothetical protein